MRRPSWLAYSQPYLSWSWGRQWLKLQVPLAEDVAAKLRRRMWTNRRRGKR